MKVKKFIASNNQEAMLKVKTELGADAVILHQRKVKPKGIFGIFKKPVVEIVAAREEYTNNDNQPIAKPKVSPEDKLKTKFDSKTRPIPTEKVEKDFSKEISEIKGMLHTVLSGLNNKSINNLSTLNTELTDFYNHLITQEIDEGFLYRIIDELKDIINQSSQSEAEQSKIFNRFEEILKLHIVDQGHRVNSKVIFFVGPTGVGKTTTIAKLAANYLLNEGKSVGLVSADTYRIAAVEQIKTYSNILNMPMEIVYEASELNNAINKLKDNDIIFVDTAGRSHKNEQQIIELKELIDAVEDKEVYLVISCTTKNKDLKEIVKTYDFLDNYKIIFTKLDEATSVGPILNIAYETQRPISYITTGQSVPDDIEILDISKITKLLLEEAKV